MALSPLTRHQPGVSSDVADRVILKAATGAITYDISPATRRVFVRHAASSGAITLKFPNPAEMPGLIITLHALGVFSSTKSLTITFPVEDGAEADVVVINSATTAFKCYYSDGSRWFTLA